MDIKAIPNKHFLILAIAIIAVVGVGFGVYENMNTAPPTPQVMTPAQEQEGILNDTDMINNMETQTDDENAAINDNTDTSDVTGPIKKVSAKTKKIPAPTAAAIIPVINPIQQPQNPIQPQDPNNLEEGQQMEEEGDPLDIPPEQPEDEDEDEEEQDPPQDEPQDPPADDDNDTGLDEGEYTDEEGDPFDIPIEIPDDEDGSDDGEFGDEEP